jgi:NADPH-dependent ferric siderophore reductase
MSLSQPPARKRRARRAEVLRTSAVTPHMVRVVLGGPGLTDLEIGEFTDHYVKLLFAPQGADYSAPFDVEEIQDTRRPRSEWPVTRTYTVRSWEAATGELTLDFVYHGDHGLAGPWAAAARPGDQIDFFGPGGGYAPDEHADWYLFVGDESALPAIAASLERLAVGAPATVFIEVEDVDEEQPLRSPGNLDLTWVHRRTSTAPPGSELTDRVRSAHWRPGAVQAFVHGEAGFVKEVRRHLRFERGVPVSSLSASGYWRRGLTDEGWRANKKEWNIDVAREEQAYASTG